MPIPVFDLEPRLQDIGHGMDWTLLHPKAFVSPRKALREARDSLVLSLVRSEERRGEFRLFNPTAGASISPQGETLLNLSRSGIAVGVRKKCAFARGERYRVILDDGTTKADLEGKVCWTRSAWSRDALEAEGSEYFQAAGLAFAEPMSSEEELRWKALRQLVQDGSVALGLRISPVR